MQAVNVGVYPTTIVHFPCSEAFSILPDDPAAKKSVVSESSALNQHLTCFRAQDTLPEKIVQYGLMIVKNHIVSAWKLISQDIWSSRGKMVRVSTSLPTFQAN